MLTHWTRRPSHTQDPSAPESLPLGRMRPQRHTAFCWMWERSSTNPQQLRINARRASFPERFSPRRGIRLASGTKVMSKERARLPEVASVEGAWMQASTLPAAVTSRGAASETDWQHYFGAVRRRKWTVVAITVLGTALGLFASRLLHPPYSATALLWFETKDRAAAARDPRSATEADELLNPSGWIDLVESNAVLEEVVRQRRLYLRPQEPADSSLLATLQLDGTPVPGSYRYSVDREGRTFTLQNTGRVVQTDSLGRPVGQGLGFSWSPRPGLVEPGHSIEFVLSTPPDAARQLTKTLSVTTDVDPALMRAGTDANFLRIELTGSRPAELAATVNAIADRVVVVAADLKRIKLVELGRILDELTTKRAPLGALRYGYTEASEPVQRVRGEVQALLQNTIPTLARGLDADLAAREQQLGRRADAAFEYLHDLPPLALEEARLQRDVTIAEQLFTTVQQSYNQTQLAAVSTLPDVRILDRATAPDRPDRNWTPPFGCASFVVG